MEVPSNKLWHFVWGTIPEELLPHFVDARVRALKDFVRWEQVQPYNGRVRLIFCKEASAQAGRDLNVSMGIMHGDKYMESTCTVVTELEPVVEQEAPATPVRVDAAAPPTTPSKMTYVQPRNSDAKMQAIEDEQTRQRTQLTDLDRRVQENTTSIGMVRKDVSSLLKTQEINQLMEKPDWHTPNTNVPFVNRPFESEIHGTVNFTQFCCVLLVTWCYRVLLSCYLRPK